MGALILLGSVVPAGGLLFDFGRRLDYVIVKNKSDDSGLLIGFGKIPTQADGYEIRPNNSGFDMGGLNVQAVGIVPTNPAPAAPVEVDVIGVETRLLSLDSTKGGSVRATNTYPFTIQLSEPRTARRKMDTIPVPQKGIYCDWISNSMGGDGGNDSPEYYPF
jgi:hypothetical protein